MIPDQAGSVGDQVERGVLDVVRATVRFNARAKTVTTLQGEIDDGTLLHPAPAVRDATGDMHGKVERPKRFAAFRRSPNHRQARAGNKSFDEICGRRTQQYRFERDELETQTPVFVLPELCIADS